MPENIDSTSDFFVASESLEIPNIFTCLGSKLHPKNITAIKALQSMVLKTRLRPILRAVDYERFSPRPFIFCSQNIVRLDTQIYCNILVLRVSTHISPKPEVLHIVILNIHLFQTNT